MQFEVKILLLKSRISNLSSRGVFLVSSCHRRSARPAGRPTRAWLSVASARNGIRSESGWRRGRGNPAKLCPVIGRIGVHCAGRAGPPSPAQLLIIFRGIAVSLPAYLLHVQQDLTGYGDLI